MKQSINMTTLICSFTLLINFSLIAQSSINVDGNSSEWKNIRVFIYDEIGDIDISRNVVSINDKGEQKITGKSYQYDVDNIKITADSKDLFILIKLAKSLKYYFKKNKEGKYKGGMIGALYFDTDNNKRTGGKIDFSKIKGFEEKLTIPIITTSSFKYSVGYWLESYDAKKGSFDFMKRIEKDSKIDPNYIGIGDNIIEMKIPIKEINISRGDIIRAVFNEEGQKGSISRKDLKEIIKKIN